ncbi:hypothetical protein M9Y10_020650 [Tritrichomonas musculus]|uniref:MSP domain-containing protein n=1 Tax=Tritrichomonas musculus TaxID=1915356 RepID=A0ABR2HGI0_9EUKA
MLCLNIQMQSFELKKGIVQDNDTIRVSVTTLPGEQKQAYSFEAKKMQTTRPFFSVKINEKTEKILIVMRKKSFSQKDPIIASTVISNKQIPMKFNDIANTEMKTINLLEPVQHSGKKNTNRKVIGKFDIQFSLTQELPFNNNNTIKTINKKRNGKGYAKMDSFLDNENDTNNYLFTDLITN